MEKRGPDGVIIPFQDKFPSGMKAIGDYIHSKGLKFGVYSGGIKPHTESAQTKEKTVQHQ